MKMSIRVAKKLADWEQGKHIRCEICGKMVPPEEVGWGNEEQGHAGLCSDCTAMAKVGVSDADQVQEVA